MKKRINKSLGVPLGLAAFSVGTGILGESLGSDALKNAGSAASGFIAPAVNISAGGMVIKQLKGLRRKK